MITSYGKISSKDGDNKDKKELDSAKAEPRAVMTIGVLGAKKMTD